MSFSDSIPIHGNETIFIENKCVGFIRRAGYSFSLNKTIGYGYINHHNDEYLTDKYIDNANIYLEIMGEKYKVDYDKNIVFDPKNDRIKGIY